MWPGFVLCLAVITGVSARAGVDTQPCSWLDPLDWEKDETYKDADCVQGQVGDMGGRSFCNLFSYKGFGTVVYEYLDDNTFSVHDNDAFKFNKNWAEKCANSINQQITDLSTHVYFAKTFSDTQYTTLVLGNETTNNVCLFQVANSEPTHDIKGFRLSAKDVHQLASMALSLVQGTHGRVTPWGNLKCSGFGGEDPNEKSRILNWRLSPVSTDGKALPMDLTGFKK
jgi:hypothetical protein